MYVTRHPLVREEQSSSRDIHDSIPQPKEGFRGKRLSKEICHIISRFHKGNTQLMIFDFFSHEEVSPFDMLDPRVVLGVVSNIDG